MLAGVGLDRPAQRRDRGAVVLLRDLDIRKAQQRLCVLRLQLHQPRKRGLRLVDLPGGALGDPERLEHRNVVGEGRLRRLGSIERRPGVAQVVVITDQGQTSSHRFWRSRDRELDRRLDLVRTMPGHDQKLRQPEQQLLVPRVLREHRFVTLARVLGLLFL